MVRSMKGWFIRTLLSYLMLAVLLLGIVGVPILSTIRAMNRSQLVEGAARNLTSLAEELDVQWYEMERTAYLTQSEGRMIPRFLQESGYYALQAVTDLKRICLTSNLIGEVALVYAAPLFDGEKKVYTSSGIWSRGLFFEYAYRYDQWSEAEINESIPNYTTPFLRPLEPIMVKNSDRTQFMTYVVPLSQSSRNERGVMLFLISGEAFARVVARANLPAEATLLLRDRSGKPLYVGGKQPQMDAEQLAALPEEETVSVDGAPALSLEVRSAFNRWQYRLLIPTHYFGSDVAGSERAVVAFLATGVICAIALSMLVTMYRFKPMRNLASRAKQILPEAVGAYQNEYEMISGTISHLERNNLLLTDRLRSQRAALCASKLRMLFEGKAGETDALLSSLAEEGIALAGPVFRVFALWIDGVRAFESLYDAATRGLLLSNFAEIVQKTARDSGYAGVACEFGRGAQAALLVSGADLSDNDARALAERLLSATMQQFRLTVSIGISAAFTALSGLSASYAAARREADRRYMTGEGCVYIDRGREADDILPVNLNAAEAKFIDLLKKEEFDLCHQVLAEYVDGVTRIQTPEAARRAMTMLLLSLRQAIRGIRLPDREAWQARVEEWLSVRVETVTEQQDAIDGMLDSLCKAQRALEDSRNTHLVGSAMAYLEANLDNPALSIDLLADHLGVSAGYLSRTFKEHTETTPMQYLDTLRMKLARLLLRDTKLSIAELLAACGYVDKTNFIRKFRRLYAMTPMGYRASEQSRPTNDNATEES